METEPEEDDPTWFRVDDARAVVMKIFAKLSDKKLENCRQLHK